MRSKILFLVVILSAITSIALADQSDGFFLIPADNNVKEATLLELSDGTVAAFWGKNFSTIYTKTSKDGGKTWSQGSPLKTAEGEEIYGFRVSPIRMKSGAIGILYSGPKSRPGRDGMLMFRKSTDQGKTWSNPITIDPDFAVLRSGCARVLKSGRILAPVFKWLSTYAGGESEQGENSLCFSWVYYSDDQGKTWNRGHSELMLSKNDGADGIYHFEEPVVEQLSDGRVLMFGRTEMGRQFQSISKDDGASWSLPKPVDLASAYTPTLLKTIPKTGDLLVIWSQAGADEIEAGLTRCRLSYAVSKDQGKTWGHFGNLESLDDVVRVTPPPADQMKVIRKKKGGYHQPQDRKRYHKAPGALRICYPSVAFIDDKVLICYDYGATEKEPRKHGTKMKILTLEQIYKN